ncbi:unnamed protein product, partial [Iphiclides podalirius]
MLPRHTISTGAGERSFPRRWRHGERKGRRMHLEITPRFRRSRRNHRSHFRTHDKDARCALDFRSPRPQRRRGRAACTRRAEVCRSRSLDPDCGGVDRNARRAAARISLFPLTARPVLVSWLAAAEIDEIRDAAARNHKSMHQRRRQEVRSEPEQSYIDIDTRRRPDVTSPRVRA